MADKYYVISEKPDELPKITASFLVEGVQFILYTLHLIVIKEETYIEFLESLDRRYLRRAPIPIPSPRDIEEPAFIDYGLLKNIHLHHYYSKHSILHIYPAVEESYLDRLKLSPLVFNPESYIDNLYAIYIPPWDPDVFALSKVKWSNLDKATIPINDFLPFKAFIDEEARVYGFYNFIDKWLLGEGTKTKSVHAHLLLHINSDIKGLLDKLIYIYTYITDYLKNEGITLKDVLEDIDLYTYVAAAAAT
jgi:hypothetical protein